MGVWSKYKPVGAVFLDANYSLHAKVVSTSKDIRDMKMTVKRLLMDGAYQKIVEEILYKIHKVMFNFDFRI